MGKFLTLLVLTVGGLYLVGVRPETIKQEIEVQRQQHATVSAFSDDGE